MDIKDNRSKETFVIGQKAYTSKEVDERIETLNEKLAELYEELADLKEAGVLSRSDRLSGFYFYYAYFDNYRSGILHHDADDDAGGIEIEYEICYDDDEEDVSDRDDWEDNDSSDNSDWDDYDSSDDDDYFSSDEFMYDHDGDGNW